MKNKNHKILFISHDANYSGAPIILLNTIKWLAINTQLDISVLFLRDGKMIENFNPYVKQTYKYYNTCTTKNKIINKFYYKYLFPIYLKKLHKKINKEKFQTIFGNSIACNSFFEKYKKKTYTRIIVNILELNYTFKAFRISNNSSIINKADIFICMNKAVAENLITNLNVNKKIQIINPIIEYYRNKVTSNKVYDQLNIPSNAIIIGASGTVEWRKGADLFIQLAFLFRKKYGLKNTYFVWTGKFENEEYKNKILNDISESELNDHVFFIGEVTDVTQYYSCFDFFTLMSREEALGIVCIENMALGNNVLCFDKCGGINEIADEGGAISVPFLDIDAMADVIHKLQNDSEYKNKLSKKAIEILNKKYDINKIGRAIIDIIENTQPQ